MYLLYEPETTYGTNISINILATSQQRCWKFAFLERIS